MAIIFIFYELIVKNDLCSWIFINELGILCGFNGGTVLGHGSLLHNGPVIHLTHSAVGQTTWQKLQQCGVHENTGALHKQCFNSIMVHVNVWQYLHKK